MELPGDALVIAVGVVNSATLEPADYFWGCSALVAANVGFTLGKKTTVRIPQKMPPLSVLGCRHKLYFL